MCFPSRHRTRRLKYTCHPLIIRSSGGRLTQQYEQPFRTSLIFGVRMSVNSFHRVYDSRLGITIEILSKAHAEVQLKAELFFSRRETNVISYPFRSHPPCRKVTASALLDRGVTVRAPATTSLSIPTVLVRGTPRVLYRHVCHRSQSMSKQSVKDRGPLNLVYTFIQPSRLVLSTFTQLSSEQS